VSLVQAADPVAAATDVLAWYDRHRRTLPWRAPAGTRADPYRVWLSEIMLQQTTVGAAGPYFLRFLEHFPDVAALAAAPLEEVLKLWAGLGYYARARNLHACAQAVVREHGGRFPDTEEGLRALPGIGAYTAGAVAAIAFDRRAAAVDGNVERVIARLDAMEEPLPGAKPRIRARVTGLVPARRAGDFAQALMDLGAMICTPKRPACALCPWAGPCRARARGDAESFPRKAEKTAGALRRGAAFIALRADGALLVRTRPAKGLLGGMTEVPTTAWTAGFNPDTALAEAPQFAAGGPPLAPEWQRLPGGVSHTFTHFPLELTVYAAEVAQGAAPPPEARFLPAGDIAAAAFPTVMRKVLAHAGVAPLRRAR
jgi:A/G-specific adenine glycosylase